MATGVGLRQILLPQLNELANPENPQFGANSVHVSSNVPELWLLEFAVGRNAIFFTFLGENMENINFY